MQSFLVLKIVASMIFSEVNFSQVSKSENPFQPVKANEVAATVIVVLAAGRQSSTVGELGDLSSIVIIVVLDARRCLQAICSVFQLVHSKQGSRSIALGCILF